MIQPETKLKVADNSGAKIAKCITVLGGTDKRYARIGDVITASVKKAAPRKEVKKHDVVKAVVIRQSSPLKREDGSYIRFDDNACVIINDQELPVGNRVLGPIPKELRKKGFGSIVTLADEIV